MSDVVGGILLMLSILLVVIVISELLGFHAIFKSLFRIDHAPLFKIKLFWFATLFPLAIALVLSIPMFSSTKFDLTPQGYSKFVELFSFPLWIASGSIIFGVLVGRFHGSVQRYEALRQTESNNNFSNFIEHKKLFFEKLDFDGITFKARLTVESDEENLHLSDYIMDFRLDKERLYKFFFSQNSYKNFDISKRVNLIEMSEIDISVDAKQLDEKAHNMLKTLSDITGVTLKKGLNEEQFWSYEQTNYPYDHAYSKFANLQCFSLVLRYLDGLLLPLSDSVLSDDFGESDLFLIKPFKPCEISFSRLNCYRHAEQSSLNAALKNTSFVSNRSN
ncbi:hypothetical protein [Alteromonas gracilis]|uniref:hypothetical protein n=1 Tax=Alteromonas gracilis TaxID=1479524 RepID=UPI0037364FE3